MRRETLLATRLARALPADDTPIISLDAYYRDLSHLDIEERARADFDAPDALDAALLREHIHALARGGAINRPVYNFTTHTRLRRTERVVPGAFVIIEGLFALYWESIRKCYALAVHVDLPLDLCLARRIHRDTRERGRTEASVRRQFEQTVRPAYERFIAPARNQAHLILDGHAPVEASVSAILHHLKRQVG